MLWLTGVDYFSTLGYQPGIALLAAGAVAPLATAILIAVTLLGALPVYAQVAGRSFAGQGSIAMLENLLTGWKSKVLVLVLLGFAATDFVITMTLSAADAAKHAIENPFLQPYLGDHQILITLGLLTLLALVFLKGFKEAIGVAAVAAIPYLLLNLVVLGRGAWEIFTHPTMLGEWRNALAVRGDFGTVMAGALLVFPKLALGSSGFETGVSVMPLIDGGKEDEGYRPRRAGKPEGRIRNTRKLLASAALIMERPDGLIIGSAFIVLVLTVSGVSRSLRSIEFRASKAYFADEQSRELAGEVVGRKVHLVPIKHNTPEGRARKRAELLNHYNVRGPFLFMHVELLDNRSEFEAPLEFSLERDGTDYVGRAQGAIAIANTLAYVSEMIDPISIFIGLTRQNLMQQATRYLLVGEGETGLMLYTILLNYWEWTPENDVRPLIFLMSD